MKKYYYIINAIDLQESTNDNAASVIAASEEEAVEKSPFNSGRYEINEVTNLGRVTPFDNLIKAFKTAKNNGYALLHKKAAATKPISAYDYLVMNDYTGLEEIAENENDAEERAAEYSKNTKIGVVRVERWRRVEGVKDESYIPTLYYNGELLAD